MREQNRPWSAHLSAVTTLPEPVLTHRGRGPAAPAGAASPGWEEKQRLLRAAEASQREIEEQGSLRHLPQHGSGARPQPRRSRIPCGSQPSPDAQSPLSHNRRDEL